MKNDPVRDAFISQVNHRTSRDSQSQINLEVETVSLVMKLFRVDRHIKQLRAHHLATNGTPGLSVDSFNACVDGFPFLLICSTLGGIKLHDDKNSTLPRMFSAFETTPLGKAYVKAMDMTRRMYENDARSPCLIVKRINVRGGLALHPGYATEEDVPGLQLRYVPGPDSPLRESIIIEPLVTLIERVKRFWTPQFTQHEEEV